MSDGLSFPSCAAIRHGRRSDRSWWSRIEARAGEQSCPRKEVSYFRKAAHGQQIKNATDGLRITKSIESQHRLARQGRESGKPVVLCDTLPQQACAIARPQGTP